jgi:hypothetical protein
MSIEEGNIRQRKVRSDKKRNIAPYINDEERELIYRIAHHIDKPEGEVGLLLVETAFYDEICIRYFSRFFHRDFEFDHRLIFRGHKDSPWIEQYVKTHDNRGRFKLKATQVLSEGLSNFQIALGTPYLAHATFALLRYALVEDRIIQTVSPGYLRQESLKMQPIATKKENVWSIL